MNRFSSQFNINLKWKSVFLLLLLVVASSLWAKVLFFSSDQNEIQNKAKSSAVNKEINTKFKAVKTMSREDFDIYKAENNSNPNPFRASKRKTAKFSYQSEADNIPLKLKGVDNSLKLQGVINQTTAIVSYKGQTLLLKPGSKVGGYNVLDIQDSKITYLKQGRKYYSTIKIEQ